MLEWLKRKDKTAIPVLTWERYTAVLEESTETDSEIRPDAHFLYDLGLSSLEVMVLIGDLEAEFGIKLEVSKLKTVKTAGDLYQLLEEQAKHRI